MHKNILKKSGIYDFVKRKILFGGKHNFENRSKNSDTAILILAGYKDFLWDIVFERIKAFAPKDADVCLISSGLYSEELSCIAKEFNWSYLSTKKNNVCIAMNIGILCFPGASWIYKIDEDIFVTKNFFNNTMDTYMNCKKDDSFYRDPIFVAPLIPINAFGYAHLLRRLGLEDAYRAKFGAPHIGGATPVESDIEFAKFIWGGYSVPSIDELDARCGAVKSEPLACPIHFSIGAILMERQMWERIGFFTGWKRNGMGADEMQLNKYAVIYSTPMLIAADTCVGHLSFGPQNAAMKEFFENNKKLFEIREFN